MSNYYSSNQKAKNIATSSREAGRDSVISSKDNSRRNMNHDIRFINSQYDKLLRIHDGGRIHVEKHEGGSFDATLNSWKLRMIWMIEFSNNLL